MKRCAILVVFAALATAGLPADLAVTVGGRHAALVVQDTRFDPAVQLVSDVSVGVARQWRPGRAADHLVAAEASLSVGRVSRSPALSGYFYRGLALRSFGLRAEWIAGGGPGLRLDARAVLASYALTTLLFFYPEVGLAPTLQMRLGDRARIDWALPVFFQFRQDLAYAIGIGLQGTLSLEYSSPES